jgi:hypothetical protein
LFSVLITPIQFNTSFDCGVRASTKRDPTTKRLEIDRQAGTRVGISKICFSAALRVPLESMREKGYPIKLISARGFPPLVRRHRAAG